MLEDDIPVLQPYVKLHQCQRTTPLVGWDEARRSFTNKFHLTQVFHVSDVTSANITFTATMLATPTTACLLLISRRKTFTFTQNTSISLTDSQY